MQKYKRFYYCLYKIITNLLSLYQITDKTLKKMSNEELEKMIAAIPEKTPLYSFIFNGKYYTSQDNLNQLSCKGVIVRKDTKKEFGYDYEFFTLDGQFIAKFYKDFTFGFCSQVTGIELKYIHELPKN